MHALGHGGEHDDGGVGNARLLAQRGDHLVAIQPRHHDVADDQFGFVRAGHLQPLHPVIGMQDPVAGLLQHRAGYQALRHVVVDQENEGHVG